MRKARFKAATVTVDEHRLSGPFVCLIAALMMFAPSAAFTQPATQCVRILAPPSPYPTTWWSADSTYHIAMRDGWDPAHNPEAIQIKLVLSSRCNAGGKIEHLRIFPESLSGPSFVADPQSGIFWFLLKGDTAPGRYKVELVYSDHRRAVFETPIVYDGSGRGRPICGTVFASSSARGTSYTKPPTKVHGGVKGWVPIKEALKGAPDLMRIRGVNLVFWGHTRTASGCPCGPGCAPRWERLFAYKSSDGFWDDDGRRDYYDRECYDTIRVEIRDPLFRPLMHQWCLGGPRCFGTGPRDWVLVPLVEDRVPPTATAVRVAPDALSGYEFLVADPQSGIAAIEPIVERVENAAVEVSDFELGDHQVGIRLRPTMKEGPGRVALRCEDRQGNLRFVTLGVAGAEALRWTALPGAVSVAMKSADGKGAVTQVYLGSRLPPNAELVIQSASGRTLARLEPVPFGKSGFVASWRGPEGAALRVPGGYFAGVLLRGEARPRSLLRVE